MTLTLGILGSLLLVAANGFFVATEFAITRIRVTQVRELEHAGRAGAKPLRQAVDNLDGYLAACQLGITVASIALGIVGKPAFEHVFEPVFGPLGNSAYVVSFAFAFGTVTLLHVVLGELTPKSLSIARTVRTALVVAVPMRVFYVATKPFVEFFNWLGNLVLKPFGVPPAGEAGHAPHSEEELRALLRQSLEEGLIDPEEREFAENVFGFGDRRARQIMVPRSEIDFVTTDQSLREAAERATESGHTRLPLCDPEAGLDRTVGVVNAKDVLRAIVEGGDPPLAELARPLDHVSESVLVDELLRDLRRDRRHVALVVDEYGTAVGLVSLEDVLEEIVGDIDDEFDRVRGDLFRREGDKLVVDGAAPVHLVVAELGAEMPDTSEATIGGHVVALLGRLPEQGEIVDLDGHRARVTHVDGARVGELVIEPEPREG